METKYHFAFKKSSMFSLGCSGFCVWINNANTIRKGKRRNGYSMVYIYICFLKVSKKERKDIILSLGTWRKAEIWIAWTVQPNFLPFLDFCIRAYGQELSQERGQAANAKSDVKKAFASTKEDYLGDQILLVHEPLVSLPAMKRRIFSGQNYLIFSQKSQFLRCSKTYIPNCKKNGCNCRISIN